MPSPPMEAQEPVAPAGLNPSGRLTPLAGEGDAQSVSAAEIELVQTDEVAVVAIQAAEVPAVVVPVEVADPQEQKQGQKVKLLMGATGFFAVLATGFLVATVVLAARLSSVDDAKTTAQVALAALSTTTTTTTVRSAGSLAGESQAALEALSGQANITVDSDFLLSIGGNDPQVVEAWTDAMSSEFPGGVVKFTAPIKVGSSGQTGGRRLQAGGSVSFSSSALVDKSTHYVNVRITFAAGAAAPSVSVELYPEIEGTMGDYHKAKFNVDSGAHSKAKAKLKGFKKPAAYKNLALHGHVLASKSGSEVLLGNPRTGFAAGRVMQVKAGQRMSISTATGKTMDHCKHSAMSRHKASCGNSPHFEANESAAQEGNGSNASRRLQSRWS
ncbi:unnamed protein product [Polarella glacialis]|uniref:Uncharacterized protein n=1 Tax=Polarella glacialis TaxID=89957 RepID=A0A813JW11_POLGL|nr:unnamed protein product [Polarella glacialis]